jgi:HSP20 family molecular chaperone IbpA
MNEDITLLIKAPGYKKEEIKINFEDGYLLINANNEKFGESNLTRYLPEDSDTENATAKLEDGILEIKIPKKKKQTKFLQIL